VGIPFLIWLMIVAPDLSGKFQKANHTRRGFSTGQMGFQNHFLPAVGKAAALSE
jgi:hypothetical protein